MKIGIDVSVHNGVIDWVHIKCDRVRNEVLK
jgi:hypothetical protein